MTNLTLTDHEWKPAGTPEYPTFHCTTIGIFDLWIHCVGNRDWEWEVIVDGSDDILLKGKTRGKAKAMTAAESALLDIIEKVVVLSAGSEK